MRFLTGLGSVTAPSVEQLSPNDGKFIFSLSYEVFDTLISDILITYYEEQAPLDELLTRSYVKSMPQVQRARSPPRSASKTSPPSPRPAPCRCAGAFRTISRSSPKSPARPRQSSASGANSY
ncbi:hypothetical protein N8D56_19080 [Devosia sp. A8/3-2]|nr:hypothetical protein N8D56_19080 [Devosia sp. A8/3-2]